MIWNFYPKGIQLYENKNIPRYGQFLSRLVEDSVSVGDQVIMWCESDQTSNFDKLFCLLHI